MSLGGFEPHPITAHDPLVPLLEGGEFVMSSPIRSWFGRLAKTLICLVDLAPLRASPRIGSCLSDHVAQRKLRRSRDTRAPVTEPG
jgi:hypothetical protein